MTKRRLGDAAAAVVLIVLTWVLYRKVTRLWWTYDDLYLLHVAITTRAVQYFSDAHLWQTMPGHMFVPLLPATYGFLLATFGLNPARWHAIQLALTGVAAVAWYGMLRLWFPIRFAFAGGILFLSGIALCSIAAEPMLIHYLIATIFAIASGIFFVLAVRRAKTAIAILSAIAYLIAILAKEIALPLPAILLLLPDGDLRDRSRKLIPHAAAFVVYALWRVAMLGTSLGGYGWAMSRRDIPAFPPKLLQVLGGPALLFVIGIGVVVALRDRRVALAALVALAMALVPIIPVSKEMQPRYGLMAWICMTALFVIGCSTIRNPRAAIALAMAGVAIALVSNRQEWGREFAVNSRMSTEGKAFLDLPADALLRNPAVPPAALGELKWFKEDYLHGGAAARWFYDDFFLCAGRAGSGALWSFDAPRRILVQIKPAGLCSNVREAPLSAEFHYRGDDLSWSLGPYRAGSWRILLGDGAEAFDVPQNEGFRLPGVRGLSLRVRYTSPAGWRTYSPELALDFVRHPDFTWHR